MNNGLTRIFLGGKLGKLFGAEWNLYVTSPAEAIRAIDINTKGKFKKYFFTKGRDKYYQVALNNKKNTLEKEEIIGYSGNQDILIFPVIKGGKSTVRIIVGIILIIVGVILIYTGYGAAFGKFLIKVGIGLVLGGVVELLIGTPDFNTPLNSSASGGSDLFTGAAAAIQGGPVTLVYGRSLVNPMPVSISQNYINQNPNAAGANLGGSNFPGGNYYDFNVFLNPATGLIEYTQNSSVVQL